MARALKTHTLLLSMALADETYSDLAALAARLAALAEGAEVIVRPGAVGRGASPEGECLVVHRLDKPLPTLPALASGLDSEGRQLAGPAQGRHYETVGYVFPRPMVKDDAERLARAIGEAQAASAPMGRKAAA